MDEVLRLLVKTDSAQAAAVLNELEEWGSHAGKYFAPRFNLLKANWLQSAKSCATTEMISDIDPRK